jgi:large subunit ribosomal protein L17
MRHQRSGKKLGRDSAHRKALYANLTGALIEHGRIKTTVTKAKAVKPIAEQMITLGRRGDLHARRQATAFLRSKDVVHKLFAEVGPQFAERPGGYTRIVKIGPRYGDAADMVYLELVDSTLVFKTRLPRETADATAAAGTPVTSDEAETEEVEAEDTDADDAETEEEAEGAEVEAEAETADVEAAAVEESDAEEADAEEAAAETEDADAEEAEAADDTDASDDEAEPQK